jgi:ClpX C4-type zinc finger
MNRRRFLALIGASVPGLWLDGIGLIQLPRRMVIDISGHCSFCGKDAREVFGLAGVIRRPARICNECIDICLEILRDDLYQQMIDAPPPPPPPDYLVDKDIIAAFDFEPIGLAHDMGIPRTKAQLEALMEQVRQHIDQSESDRQWPMRDTLNCSFCDKKQDDVSKLVAGPQTYICDYCIGDAAALLGI